jgi:hypothetical protein
VRFVLAPLRELTGARLGGWLAVLLLTVAAAAGHAPGGAALPGRR